LEHELTSGFAGGRIRRKALQLARIGRFSKSDIPDLQQDLAMVLIRALPVFNPRRAHWHVFVVTVVERGALTILRSRWRAKRRLSRPITSLETLNMSPSGHITSVASIIEPRHVSAITGRTAETPLDAVDRHEGLEVVAQSLTPDLKHLCYRLQFEPVAEVSRRMHLSRTTLYQKIKSIRKVMLRHGFDDFSKNSRTPWGERRR
jgi:DNA-directed RNA polymerase specialized sigma24 family protein